MSLLIRPMRPEDRETVIGFVQALNMFEHGLSGDRCLDRASAEQTVAELEEGVAAARRVVLLAEIGGTPAGFLGWSDEEDDVYVAEELRRYGYISDLYVDAAFRGGGVAQALLTEAEGLTRERGIKRLFVGVLAGNAAAEIAYARFGFSPYAATLMKEIA
ncbi:GNAT family N-acetyltransferase [Chelatococcus sp. SYSU_G07232]|uniref:GNAT family N-acetyltransferase n=1 Tax=Chelatococcus albus TaxID=3047466 RepID=A0ABT7AFX5_9HYPH|nr:GNAT family N-acetyltransferase [Chelatococcus sp. SYSU_G07232]MDJ1158282.1 GNAT family N-acetyltransferase [Chelatococcus sp. SYSU_G07232]